ncbi:22738_t:CDS:2 [Rhizophagus irregularis]|nr:22738_t:CDS:2 [Rhizophagus irregularis]
MLIAWDLLTNQLKKDIKVDKKLIPTYHPYNSNRIPTREAVEEFDANDRKVVTHLAKDDKMKGDSFRVRGFFAEGRLTFFVVGTNNKDVV